MVPVEVDENLPALPLCRNFKLRAVRADGVVVVGDVGRIDRKRVTEVGIDGDTVILQLPVAGHRDMLPAADIVIGFVEVLRSVGGFADPVELPVAVK